MKLLALILGIALRAALDLLLICATRRCRGS